MTHPAELDAEVRRLYFAEHWKVGTIATQLNVHPDSVKRACQLIERRQPKPRTSILAPYHEFIDGVLKQYPTLRATRLMAMLTERGYRGSISLLRQHVRRVRPIRSQDPVLRVETLAGEQAQIDWAFVRDIDIDGAKRRLWLFLIVLSYSRAMWGEFVLDLTSTSLRRSLVRAMDFFGGSPRVWLFDNAKSIAVMRYGKAVQFHHELLELADIYRAEPRVCDVRAPRQKGKVERLVRYVRDAFLGGREIGSIAQGNRELLEFIAATANMRPHPVRGPETVAEAFEHEKTLLLPLPQARPDTDQLVSIRVSRDSFVRFDTNSYSVPHTLCGKTVTLAASQTRVRIIDGDLCQAEHPRCWGKHARIESKEHRDALIAQRKKAQPSRAQDRMRAAAPNIDTLLERWVKNDRHIPSQTRKALKLLELYGEKLFAKAVELVVSQTSHDVGALAVACEKLRQQAGRPVPVPIERNDLPERDVIPHALEAYDQVTEREQEHDDNDTE